MRSPYGAWVALRERGARLGLLVFLVGVYKTQAVPPEACLARTLADNFPQRKSKVAGDRIRSNVDFSAGIRASLKMRLALSRIFLGLLIVSAG